MKKPTVFGLIGVFLIGLLFSVNSYADVKSQTVTHVVLVWLKKPGDKARRQQFVSISKQLNDLPGIIHRHVGEVMSSDRKVVDDTFDVAVTATFRNKKALQAYLDHPRHKKIIHEKLKPMINRVVIYDFVGQ
jgi:hypothetical protein